MAQIVLLKELYPALTEKPEKIKYMVDEFKIRRNLILELLNDITGFKCNIPDGHFMFFLIFRIILENNRWV